MEHGSSKHMFLEKFTAISSYTVSSYRILRQGLFSEATGGCSRVRNYCSLA